MAKGFGSILATLASAARQAEIESAPACPLCGEPMEGNGTAFFCYRGRKEHLSWLHDDARAERAYQHQLAGGIVFIADLETSPKYRFQNWDPAMQGVLIAVAEYEGKVLRFMTVRGGNGNTNFRVDMNEEVNNYAGIEWSWAEWTGNVVGCRGLYK